MNTYYHFILHIMPVLLLGCSSMPTNTKQTSNIIKVIHQNEYQSNRAVVQTKPISKVAGKIEPIAYQDEKSQAHSSYTKKALFQYTIKKKQL